MNAKSTLRVYNKEEIKSIPGVVKGQTLKVMIGSKEQPSERVRATVATFEPGRMNCCTGTPSKFFIM